jgi:hypothetical protein
VKIRALLVVAFAATVPCFAQNGARATLVCRIGGSMVWSVVTQLEAVPTQINGRNVRVPVVNALFAQLVFAKAGIAVAPDGTGLAPGVCGWTDRGMTAAEPGRVTENINTFNFQETVIWGNGSTLRGETTMSGGHLNPQNKAVFTMTVIREPGAVEYQVMPGTAPKVLSTK